MGLLSTLFGVDDEQARGDQLDAQLAQMNDRDYAPGGKIYNNIQATRGDDAANQAYNVVQQHLDETKTGNVDQQLNSAFGEGLNEGLQNEKNFVNRTVTGIFGALPWTVWALLAVGAFLYFGGLKKLKESFA